MLYSKQTVDAMIKKYGFDVVQPKDSPRNKHALTQMKRDYAKMDRETDLEYDERLLRKIFGE